MIKDKSCIYIYAIHVQWGFFHPWHGKILRIKILLLNTVGRHLDQFFTLDLDYFQTA